MTIMYTYGMSSKAKLQTVHHELRESFELALSWQIYDIVIIHGWRGEVVQNQAFLDGNSTKEWPDSEHNFMDEFNKPLSLAVDFGPWCYIPKLGKMGIPWDDTHAFAVIGGIVLAAAKQLGYEQRYGGDWDMDGLTTDQTLMDWGHIERVST